MLNADMKKIIICALLLSGCASKKSNSVLQTSNPDIELEKLFEYNGCVMYRFKDNGHYVYWSDCRGRTEYETGGKNSENVNSMTE